MTHLPELPKAASSRLNEIDASLVVAAYLKGNDSGLTPKQLSQRLKQQIGDTAVDSGLTGLLNSGKAEEVAGKIKLTESGQRWIVDQIPHADDWNATRGWVLPALALSLDPRHAKAADVIRHRLEGTALAVLYGFSPGSEGITAMHAASAFLFHHMRERFPEWQFPAYPPQADSLDPVSRLWLNMAAGLQKAKGSTCVSELVARALSAKDRKRDSLKRALVFSAIKTEAEPPALPPRPVTEDFASQVRTIARREHREPFDGRTSIARVYEAWHRQTNDLASLDAFKARLVQAAREGKVELVRLDDSRMMEPDERSRSATRLGLGEVHFVVFEWV